MLHCSLYPAGQLPKTTSGVMHSPLLQPYLQEFVCQIPLVQVNAVLPEHFLSPLVQDASAMHSPLLHPLGQVSAGTHFPLVHVCTVFPEHFLLSSVHSIVLHVLFAQP